MIWHEWSNAVQPNNTSDSKPFVVTDEERTIIRLALRQATQIFQIHADKMSQIQQQNRNTDIFEYSCRQHLRLSCGCHFYHNHHRYQL